MLTLVTPPTVEPVSLAEAKAHLRVTFSDEDDLISGLIQAARQACENETDRSFVQTAWRLDLPCLPLLFQGLTPYRSLERLVLNTIPRPTYLPKAPLASVTSISYVDFAGTRQTLSPSAYDVVGVDGAEVVPAYGTTWPVHRVHPGSVQVSFLAGYGATADAVPACVKAAIKLLVGHLYNNRETVVLGQTPSDLPWGVSRLLDPVRWGHYA